MYVEEKKRISIDTMGSWGKKWTVVKCHLPNEGIGQLQKGLNLR